ncbi:hypothetical protein BDV93DRAFT_435953, partial [Ceratobasidium sp. AG-I]
FAQGPEHEATATANAQPSYCSLPIFHPPQPRVPQPTTGYISMDGHLFNCQNPARLHQAYHVLFVIDSSGSMTSQDRTPLANTPVSATLRLNCNNRYGAVLSALHGFWHSRESATARQDAYSVVSFDHVATTRITNDLAGTASQLIEQLIPMTGHGGTNFTVALAHTQALIRSSWASDK